MRILSVNVLIILFLLNCASTSTVTKKEGSEAELAAAQNSNLDKALDDLTSQIVNSMAETGKKKVAVVEFADLEGRVTEFGMYLAEELITRLFMTKKFDVVERQLLNKILAEQQLSLTGMVDEESAQKLGKILGVDAIVSGTITDLISSLKVNARLISTETGSVFAVAATKIAKDDTVIELTRKQREKPEKRYMEEPDGQIVSENILFFEDFENMNAELGDRWEVVSGDWRIVEDWQADGSIGYVVEQRSTEGNILLAKDGQNWVDYTMEVDVKLFEGRLAPMFIFRGQDRKAFYVWIVGFNWGRSVGHRIRYVQKGWGPGEYEELTPIVDGRLISGRWYHIRIEVEGDQIKCYIDDRLVQDTSHGGFYRGTIGIGAINTIAHFDNVQVTAR